MFHVKKALEAFFKQATWGVYGAFLLSLLVWWWVSIQGKEQTRPWQEVSVLQQVGLQKTVESVPGLPLSITEPVYYVQQYWLPSAVTIPTEIWRLAGWVTWGIWLLMAYGFYRWGRRYFGLWMLFLAVSFFCFRWEMMWESTQTSLGFWFIAAVGLYTYALQHDWISKGKTIALVLGGFLLVTITWYGAQVREPLAIIWGYGSLWVFLLACWFVIWVAPSVLSAMFALVLANAEKGKSNWPTILGISGIYLINLCWLYALEVKWLDPSTAWISPPVIFFISLGTGWWFFRQQHLQSANHRFPAPIWWAGAMAVWAILLWSDLAWLDAWKEALSEWITIAYFWMGIAYIIHLAINFYPLIQAGMPIHKIWHQPRRLPWILPQLGGLVACIVTLSFKNGYTLDQGIAGMYHQQADYHLAAGESELAQTLYQEGLRHDSYGWKGNYSLGMIARKNQQSDLAARFFQRILQKSSEPAAAVALSQSLIAENMLFDGIFVLQKAVQKNQDARILTQMAYVFGQAKAMDSMQVYMQKAYLAEPNRSVEKTNYLAGMVQGLLPPLEEPSLETPLSYGEKANWTAQWRKEGKSQGFGPDSTLPQGVDRFAWIFNQALLPQAPAQPSIHWGPGGPGWEMNQKELTFAQAHQAYRSGAKKEGIDILRRIVLTAAPDVPPLFLNTYASWLAEEGAWLRFQEDIFPYLTPEQRLQIIPGKPWEIKQENQLKSWNRAKENAFEQYPFHEKIILLAVEDLVKTQGKEKAYLELVKALDYYDAPVGWWEKYVELAAAQGLASYVASGLEEVKKRDEARYRLLAPRYAP